MNKVVLIGRLTKDPELRFTPGTGRAVATFTLAVNRRFKSQGQPDADFIPVVVWGKIAENTANYVTKGRQVGVSGSIQTRSYEAKDGTRRYVTEVVADSVEFLESKNVTQQSYPSNQENFGEFEGDYQEVNDGSIPF